MYRWSPCWSLMEDPAGVLSWRRAFSTRGAVGASGLCGRVLGNRARCPRFQAGGRGGRLMLVSWANGAPLEARVPSTQCCGVPLGARVPGTTLQGTRALPRSPPPAGEPLAGEACLPLPPFKFLNS